MRKGTEIGTIEVTMERDIEQAKKFYEVLEKAVASNKNKINPKDATCALISMGVQIAFRHACDDKDAAMLIHEVISKTIQMMMDGDKEGYL